MSRLFPPTLLKFLILVLLAGSASASTYYIAANGNDSNSGTATTAPWAHAPGMPNCSAVCASVSPKAGDQFIFRGGDTWHFGNSATSTFAGGSWSWKWSGSSGSPIYIGVSKTWFSGTAWARPVLNWDNPLWTGSGFPASCAHTSSGVLVGLGSHSYVTFDNFEFTGVCWTGQAGQNGAMLEVPGGATNIIVSNDYFHGWTMTSGASDNFPSIETFGSGASADFNQYVGIVVDGSDSPHFPAGSSFCQWFSNDSAGCASGQGFNGSHVYDVHNSIVRYVSNIMVTGNCHTMHDNVFEYLYDSFASGSLQQHPNVMNCIGGATGDNLYWYNNIMRHTHATENVYFAVRTNIYFFNNVMYDNMSSAVGLIAGGCIRFNNVSNSTQPTNAYIYNNTFGDSTCQLKFEVSNSPLTPWSGIAHFENNHLIGFSSLGGLYICSTGGVCDINDNGNEVYQTAATANAQGYTASNNYAPGSGSAATVHGGSAVSSCATFSPDSEICGGTSDGVFERNSAGGQIASFPAIPMVARGTSWDVGAYQYSGTVAQQPDPPSSLTAVVQ